VRLFKHVPLLIVFAVLVVFVSVGYLLTISNGRIKTIGDTDVLDGVSGCALGTHYKYAATYPLLVRRRFDTRSVPFKEYLSFPRLPNEEEFKQYSKVTSDGAIKAIDKRIIYFTDGIVPHPTEYNYRIRKEDVQHEELITLRSYYCGSRQGDIDSEIRIVWHLIVIPAHGMSFLRLSSKDDFHWHVFVDAVTGEVVYVVRLRSDENYKRQAIPEWYMDGSLQKFGAEYLKVGK